MYRLHRTNTRVSGASHSSAKAQPLSDLSPEHPHFKYLQDTMCTNLSLFRSIQISCMLSCAGRLGHLHASPSWSSRWRCSHSSWHYKQSSWRIKQSSCGRLSSTDWTARPCMPRCDIRGLLGRFAVSHLQVSCVSFADAVGVIRTALPCSIE